MKLVIAIVHDEDSFELIEELTDNGYKVTKLATTGGFLKAGNTTLLIGVEKEKVDSVLSIIQDVCKTRKGAVSMPSPIASSTGVFVPTPVEVTIGGATVFVLDIERFERI
ncbi:cyclic-di-AMP receptor [Caloramator sp. mosi_1]|uniref:cyclic-di-AMP receptor n=1 Tax=Caloramator sp. mosi_1 TaxID=3023090 RepID=UPI00235DECDD|nr:cyclic-di-AMP receptor [Caloramator sp. mosi_1]WDC85082.1 cyclic-di-AMP receptor [Caloramator sp. mosi_1]